MTAWIERQRNRFDAVPIQRRRWWVLWTLMIGSLIGGLDATIVNVSIPALMTDFRENFSRVQWVVSSYMIAYAVLMPVTSWLRDQIGSRALYIACLFIFTLGSLLCGIAWDLESLVVFRVIQALGGGAMTPIAMAILAETFPSSEKGKALGIWGAGVLLGPIFGAPLGGFLTEFSGWRSIFLVNLPIGLVGIVAAALFLRRDKPREGAPKGIQWRSFNFAGFALLSGFLISLLYGAALVETGGGGSQTVYLCGIASIVFLITFMVSELRSPSTLLDFSLFRSRTFGLAIAIALIRSFALYGGQFLLPLFLARVQSYTENRIGLMILPGSVLIAALFPFSGRFSDRFGAKPFIIIGLAILVLFFASLSSVSVDTSFWGIQTAILLRGLGLGLLVAPLTSMTLGAIPTSKSASGSVILNLAQQMGGSLGIASLGGVLELRSGIYRAQGIEALPALVVSFQDAFRLGVFICALALVMAFALESKNKKKRGVGKAADGKQAHGET